VPLTSTLLFLLLHFYQAVRTHSGEETSMTRSGCFVLYLSQAKIFRTMAQAAAEREEDSDDGDDDSSSDEDDDSKNRKRTAASTKMPLLSRTQVREKETNSIPASSLSCF
jgi:hypothetical protein